MKIIQSEGQIIEIRDFLNQMSHMSQGLGGSNAQKIQKGFRSIGIDYVLPIIDGGEVANVAYRMCVEYCNKVFTDSIRANIREILDAIATLRTLLTGLFKLQKVGVQQSRANMLRFNRCKEDLLKYMDTPGYRYASIGADRNSEIMQKLRERFSVDKATGVFYLPDRQQYFLACAEDPSSLDSSKFNVLCNTDGMLLIYDEAKPAFYRHLLDSVTSEIIQAVLRQ